MAYTRLRALWGGLDWQHGTENPYTTAQTKSLGTSAAPGSGNIGVRRSTLVFDRNSYTPADDDINCHFDWLNITGGNPDDTWTTTDFTTLETLLQAFWTSLLVYVAPNTKLREIRWYRVGVGITPPNPAERVFTLPTMIAGTTTGAVGPPQMCSTITFRTAVRRSWGRTYLPVTPTLTLGTARLGTALVDLIAGSANTMVNSAASSDFHLVVTSKHLSASLNVEKLECDDVSDIVRRRRWKHTSYRKILP